MPKQTNIDTVSLAYIKPLRAPEKRVYSGASGSIRLNYAISKLLPSGRFQRIHRRFVPNRTREPVLAVKSSGPKLASVRLRASGPPLTVGVHPLTEAPPLPPSFWSFWGIT
jgi:hypothetical protein